MSSRPNQVIKVSLGLKSVFEQRCHCQDNVLGEGLKIFQRESPASYLLHINLDVFLEVVSVQVQDQIMDKIKAVTHDDQWKLVSQFCFLKEKAGHF